MSSGARIPLARAEAAAAVLMERWGLDTAWCTVIGSVRRRRPDVGDIEFLVPACEKPTPDDVYERIAATTKAPPTSLFGQSIEPPFADAIKGLKPHFLYCQLTVNLGGKSADEPRVTIPIEIHRCTDASRGWKMLMRTGPAEFGERFLAHWKGVWNIPREKPASVDGHLVDQWGHVVPVPDEEIAFRLCRMTYIPPEKRDEIAQAASRAHSREQREIFR